MTLQELITDLKAAGANKNTIRLAMNCYELGKKEEREACAALIADWQKINWNIWDCADAILAREQA